MKTRTTLLFLVIAGGFFTFTRLYEKKHPPTKEAAARAAYLLPFNRDNIDGIVLTRYGDRIELNRNGARWELKAPVKDRADQRAVEEILTQCELLRQEAVLIAKKGDSKRLSDFGLGLASSSANSSVRLELRGRKAPPELLFGKPTAVEGKSYARLEGKDNVYVVSNDLHDLIVRKPDALRDHQMTALDPTLATRLLFKTAAGEIALSKTGGHWGLDKPIKGRADDMRVTEFIGDILNMQIAAFPENPTLSGCGLSEPRASVTIWSLGEPKPLTLQLGAHDAKTDQTYACISSREALFLLPKQIEKLLTLTPADLRDKHLLRVDMDLVDRLSIEPAGKPRLVLKRQQEDWVQLDRTALKPVNPAKVQALLHALQTGQISAFVSDVSSDLAKFGLEHPPLRVTFSSYASENTAESNAGEHPLLTVDFGSTEGNTVYACVEDEPFVVSVDKALLDDISGNPAEWRPLPVFDFKPEEIVALEVTELPDSRNPNSSPPQTQTVSLKRAGAVWQLPGFPGVANNINVQSLVNTLARLTAVRWGAGETKALKAPTETILFRTADGKARKLVLGAASGNNGCEAMVDGDTASFSLSAPDESALRLPLVDH